MNSRIIRSLLVFALLLNFSPVFGFEYGFEYGPLYLEGNEGISSIKNDVCNSKQLENFSEMLKGAHDFFASVLTSCEEGSCQKRLTLSMIKEINSLNTDESKGKEKAGVCNDALSFCKSENIGKKSLVTISQEECGRLDLIITNEDCYYFQ
jgi:hypothetical protein